MEEAATTTQAVPATTTSAADHGEDHDGRQDSKNGEQDEAQVKIAKVKVARPSKTIRSQAIAQIGIQARIEALQSSIEKLKILVDPALGDREANKTSEEEDGKDPHPRTLKSIAKPNIISLKQFTRRHNEGQFLLTKKHHTFDTVTASAVSAKAAERSKVTEQKSTPGIDYKSISKDSESVRFIQINSQALCAVLHEYARHGEPDGSDPPQAPVVMLAPFKPLCYYETKLKNHLEKLSMKYKGVCYETSSETAKDADAEQLTKLDSATSADQTVDPVEADNLGQESAISHEDLFHRKYMANWDGHDGYLSFSHDGKFYLWTQTKGTTLTFTTFAIGIDIILHLYRTVKDSILVGLKVDTYQFIDQFIFNHPETAQEDLYTFSNALTILRKRIKEQEALPGSIGEGVPIESLSSGAPNIKKPITDAVLGAAGSDRISAEDYTERTAIKQEMRKFERVLFKRAVWERIDEGIEETNEHDFLLEADRKSDGFKAYQDLTCLIEFYDQYVSPSWQRLRNRSVDRVRYGDLGYLFRPGDNIYIPEDEHKVWRIMSVTGGRPYLGHLYSESFSGGIDSSAEGANANKQARTTAKDDDGAKQPKTSGADDEDAKQAEPKGKAVSESGKWSELKIDCYFIDFDGRRFAPFYRRFTFKYYPGLRDVKALRAYPIDWWEKKEPTTSVNILKELRDNGERFMNLCHTEKELLGSRGTRLFYYEGRTYTRSPSGMPLPKEPLLHADDGLVVPAFRQIKAEDVSSHVVVDFDRTFQAHPDWAPRFDRADYAEQDNNERVVFTIARGADPALDFVERSCQWEATADEDQTIERAENDIWMQPAGEEVSSNRDQIKPGDYMLLPDTVFGFVLRTRTWACLDVRPTLLKDIKTNTSGWEELQIPDKHRTTLESLVKRHFSNKEAARQADKTVNFDVVEGKGQGLIVLLHGAPGLGKTSTAETIAAEYNKPLLPITCGNLGLDARSVEKALQENFELAQAWDCIVLLDEADVFLAQRNHSDLERNALVSVFLRTLEYYSGILFLTTNRVGTFDEAFRSRVHSALFYQDLGRVETRAIWETNLARFEKQKKQELNKEDRNDILLYAEGIFDVYVRFERPPWNGRQIRNAFQTAVALAEHRPKTSEEPVTPGLRLKWTNFRDVVLANQDFEKYVIDTHGGVDDYDRAEENKWRRHGTQPQTLHQRADRKKERLERAEQFSKALEAVHPHIYWDRSMPTAQPIQSPAAKYGAQPGAYGNFAQTNSQNPRSFDAGYQASPSPSPYQPQMYTSPPPPAINGYGVPGQPQFPPQPSPAGQAGVANPYYGGLPTPNYNQGYLTPHGQQPGMNAPDPFYSQSAYGNQQVGGQQQAPGATSHGHQMQQPHTVMTPGSGPQPGQTVPNVMYPGLPNHPQQQTASGLGGVVGPAQAGAPQQQAGMQQQSGSNAYLCQPGSGNPTPGPS